MKQLHTLTVFILPFIFVIPPVLPAVSLDEQITEVIEEHGGVGLTAWSVDDLGNLCSLGSAGERLKGSGQPFITTGDSRHHVGSITKGITTSLMAVLLEAGIIPGGWDATMKSLLPVSAGTSYEDVTLRDVVSHHAGFIDRGTNETIALIPPYVYDPNDLRDIRRALSAAVLLSPPTSAPGTAFLYTNWGYLVAGHIIEEFSGMKFEEALTTRLFRPLGIDLGDDRWQFFGAPDNDVDPVGHFGADLIPCFPSPEMEEFCDSPPVWAPAGTFSGPVAAMARYFSWHIQCHNGSIPKDDPSYSLLSQESCQEIHQPADPAISEYGYGWWWVDAPWTDGQIIRIGWHHGFNKLNYYMVTLATSLDRAYVAYTNSDRPESADNYMLRAAINAVILEEEDCAAPIPSSVYIQDSTSDAPAEGSVYFNCIVFLGVFLLVEDLLY